MAAIVEHPVPSGAFPDWRGSDSSIYGGESMVTDENTQRVTSCRYDHTVRRRGLSDPSLLVVDLVPPLRAG